MVFSDSADDAQKLLLLGTATTSRESSYFHLWRRPAWAKIWLMHYKYSAPGLTAQKPAITVRATIKFS